MDVPARLEGTWEEILQHAAELAGKRVRVTVLDADGRPVRKKRLRRENREMLALLEEWNKTPLSEEEIAVLEEMEAYRKEHPFSLRQLGDEP